MYRLYFMINNTFYSSKKNDDNEEPVKDGMENGNQIILYETETLEEMDEYLQQFSDSDEVRLAHAERVYELLQINNTSKGYVCLFKVIDDKKICQLTALYKDQRILSKRDCLRKIKEGLQDDSILKKILEKKPLILSDDWRYSLIGYFSKRRPEYRAYFVKDFYYRLSHAEKDKQDCWFNYLMNVFGLKKENVKNLKVPNPSKFPKKTKTDKEKSKKNKAAFKVPIMREKTEDEFSESDAFMYQLISNGDWETLHNIYGMDELDTKTTVYDDEPSKKI